MHVIAPSKENFDPHLGYTGYAKVLDGSPKSLLNWEILEEEPHFWDLELDLELLQRPLFDLLQLNTLRLAVSTLVEKAPNMKAVVLYKGNADISYRFPWDEDSLEEYRNWKEEVYGEAVFESEFETHLKRVFCLSMLSDLVHQLGAELPIEVPAYLLLDVSGLGSPAHQAHALSKARFRDIELGVRGLRFPAPYLNWEAGKAYQGYFGRLPIAPLSQAPTRGICLPKDPMCTPETLSKIDQLLEDDMRIIPEELLTESWDGLDDLLVLENALSPGGDRKLQGFIAAGGRVLHV